jgi:hypothetical protein
MVQVSTDAKARPTITAFTTMSAAMNMPHGERSRGSLRAKSGEFEAWAVTGESTAGATAGAAAGFVAGVAGAGCGAVGDGDVAAGAVCARSGHWQSKDRGDNGHHDGVVLGTIKDH